MLRALAGTAATHDARSRQGLHLAVRTLSQVELWWHRAVWGFRRRYGRLGPLQVVPYRSFGTAFRAVVRGRVLEASVLERSLPDDTRLRSIRRMLRRFNSSEVPEAAVRAEAGSARVDGVTDLEGYFSLSLGAAELSGTGDWKLADVAVVGAPVRGFAPVHAQVEVLVPDESAELGIISDVDDTVLQTHVSQKLKMVWVTLSGSAFTRMTFEGTTELYRALAAGASGSGKNPVFYVSKSPWNLYDFLVDFLNHHDLPRGPLLLRDIGSPAPGPVDHKTAAVHSLLETYPRLPFILIGDSGERDAEIYLETAQRFPGRVKAIYIRDLGGQHPHRERLCEAARACGTEMVWMEHANLALQHARQRGWALTQ